METLTKEELNVILKLHKKWLNGEENGERANLRDASLIGANLRVADLFNTTGDKNRIHTIQTSKYTINILDKNIVQIGCERHEIVEWLSFDDATISKMDNGALEWWRVWKPMLIQYVEILKGDKDD